MRYKLFITTVYILILATFGFSQTTVITEKSDIEAALATATSLVSFSSNRYIKDSPFSAEGVSESTQTLSDGNRIIKKSSVKMFRDSEGRFRREGVGGTGGYNRVWAISSFYGSRNSIYIYDTVESVRYVLKPSKKTARQYKFRLPKAFKYYKRMNNGNKSEIKITDKSGKPVSVATLAKIGKRESKTESLGTKFIEGVEVEGKKTTTTIPANQIGNERPIESVYERWYSKELGMIVYSRNYDPRYGEQIYRLTNIDRNEPASSLFMVPSDYKIVKRNTLRYKSNPKLRLKTKLKNIQ